MVNEVTGNSSWVINITQAKTRTKLDELHIGVNILLKESSGTQGSSRK